MTVFIDVVSPVDGEVVDNEVALVGCANVFEATVNWRLSDDAGGDVLAEGFTTADCSMTCNGVFDDVIDLGDVSGTVSLDVFSQNMADEGPDELELTTVTFEVS